MKYSINRKKKLVKLTIGDSVETIPFEEAWAFIYLLMRKMASSHRA